MSKKQQSLTPVAINAFIVALLAWLTACQKEPIPEPIPTPTPTPTDTVTPVIPSDTITPVIPGDTITPTPGDTLVPGGDTITPVPGGKVVSFCYDGGENFPPLDSVLRYANDPTYDSIYIIWAPCGQTYWTPVSFNYACKEFKKRFDLSPKVFGKGFILPYQILPDCDSMSHNVKGMIQSNKDQYEHWHYDVWPVVGDKNTKKPQQVPHYKGTMALPRNNCRGGRVRGR
ncbi:MAG: hypothetical protein IKS08_05265 [Alphaproteobacteria bacterium]|nr:hypothetical protein [Alphaproteobacteria bacterium]